MQGSSYVIYMNAIRYPDELVYRLIWVVMDSND